ncbi:MAG: Lar family restriction alleviation protein [Ruminococcus sp.]|nr:Lar family restriction alleviation protein [Ruminococcus sp.]
MNEIKLKPCPFCGREAILKEKVSKDEIRYYVLCGKCMSKSHMFVTEKDAVDAWNRRAKNETD